MKLALLDARFVRYSESAEGVVTITHVPTIAAAQGIRFLCPKCFEQNSGPVGTHQVICWSRSRGVPDEARPQPGRWALEGSGLDDLTLNADPPGTARSIQLHGGCEWHGFVTNGEAA